MSDATILLRIAADASGLTKGLKDARGGLNDLNGDIELSAAKIEGAFVGALAAAAAALAGLTAAGFNHIDQQRDLARQLDVSIDGLRAVQLAAKEGGVDADTLTANMEKLNIALGKAANGGDAQSAAFAKLGLSINALAGMDADQRLEALADAMKDAKLTATEAATALANLGIKGGSELGAFLREGGDSIRAARQDVVDFGLSVSAVDATTIDRAKDSMARMGLVFESVSNQLAIAFAPVLDELATEFNNLSKENGGFGEVARNVAESVSKAFGYVADAVYFLRTGFQALLAAGFTLAEGLIRGFDGVVSFWAGMVDNVIGGINAMIEAFNSITGTDLATIDPFSNSPFMEGLDALANSAKTKGAEARAALVELATQPLPHTAIDEFWTHATERAALASADEVARQEAERETFAQHLAAKEEIQQAAYTIELDSYWAQMKLKADIAKQGEVDLSLLHSQGLSEREMFQAKSWQTQVSIVSGALELMTSGVARHSKAMFELNKAAGIANAIINTIGTVMKAWNDYGWPVGAVVGAAAAVAGAAQVQQIAATQFGSKTAPSQAAQPVVPVAQASGGGGGGNSTMRVEGVSASSLMTGSMVRSLTDAISDHVRDGGKVEWAD
jgi:hypothetical protein